MALRLFTWLRETMTPLPPIERVYTSCPACWGKDVLVYPGPEDPPDVKYTCTACGEVFKRKRM